MRGLVVLVVSLLALGAPVSTTSSLEHQIRERIAASGADVAVAFQTLDGRQSFLIQADEPFHAASMIKVPIMIELFRQAHLHKLKLTDRIPVVTEFKSVVDGSPIKMDVGADADPTLTSDPDGRASYRELCESMITVSSNLAANVLLARLTPARVQATTNGLGARGMKVSRGLSDEKAFDKGLNNTTTARALLTLFRRLAGGTVVDRTSSAEMMGMLERQQAREGIPAGLPAGTRVAHKTGVVSRIHHDAGVVFGPRPFVLVVLVGGLDDDRASSAVIADVTRLTYHALTPSTN